MGANLTDVISNDKFEFITPSKWASQAFLKAGFHTDRVHIVSHGVDPQLFKVSKENRRLKYRSELGLNDDDFVLFSISALTWNKGQDILIRAFAKLRLKYKNLKLVIKDQHSLYGIDVIQFIETYNKSPFPFNLTEEILNSIIFISANLSFDQLQGFYSASDCYVSPYRGEGFNLPVLEAAACGVPVIVTRGGSTDDFFSDLVGAQVESTTMSLDGITYLEPNIDDLIFQIEKIYQNKISNSIKIELSNRIRQKYSWEKVTKSLFKVISQV
jgi:glycosyltransferase involved in cell wall biosynthesis